MYTTPTTPVLLGLRLPRLNPYVLAGASRVGVQIVSLLTMVTAVARLDPATFGAFSIAWVLTVIGNAVLYAGLYQYLLRSSDLEADKPTVFWALVLQGAAVSSVMLIAGAVARYSGSAAVATSLLVLAPLTLFSAASSWCDSLLTRRQRTATVGIIYLLAEVVGALVLVLALSAGLRLWALLGWRVASTSAALMGLAVAEGSAPGFGWSSRAARAALQEAVPLQGGTLVRTLSMYAADYLLAFFLNPAASGAYRAASRVAVAGSDMFLQPLRPMTWEAMARHERERDLAAMATSYLQQLRFVAFFGCPVLLCVALFSRRLFDTFAAQGWASAAPVLVLLALARVPTLFDAFLDPVLVCTGRTGLQFRLRAAQTLIALLGVALTARYGPLAVALWQFVLATAVAAFGTRLIVRALQVLPSRVLGATAPALAVSVLCCMGGEVAFRSIELGGPFRLVASIATMGVCLSLGFVVLQQRGLLQPPRY